MKSKTPILRIILLERAEIEIDDSAFYYDSQKTGLGSLFLLEVERICVLISRNPERFTKNRDGFREAPLQRFPFRIIYKMDKDELYVVSVFHIRRNPSKKPK
ncbi:MAG TPA: type II toxin-antitoxin system RelE/ParE family toxin [Leeuwenhoekiella sp.]|nr:type II toxin-antitoxin system RelE/ParE family toxin [Leeuwenhoekiella sp.]